jgi:hypothetical protein
MDLFAPQQVTVQVEAAPRPTSTDKFESALNALLADQRGETEKPN